MTQDDIIRMARDSGVRAAKLLHEFGTEGALCDSEIQDLRAAERLAQAAYAAGAAAEREECAKLADWEPCLTDTSRRIADAIRARGEVK